MLSACCLGAMHRPARPHHRAGGSHSPGGRVRGRPECTVAPRAFSVTNPMLRDWQSNRTRKPFPTLTLSQAAGLCRAAVPPAIAQTPAAGHYRCDEPRLAESVQLLVGVLTAPGNRDRREAIRTTWGRPGQTVAVCFVLGARGMKPAQLAELEAERRQHGDLILLGDATDGCSTAVSIGKAFAWWRHAASLLPGRDGALSRALVAKTDDDSYLRLPQLLGALGTLHCHSFYYGAMAMAGCEATHRSNPPPQRHRTPPPQNPAARAPQNPAAPAPRADLRTRERSDAAPADAPPDALRAACRDRRRQAFGLYEVRLLLPRRRRVEAVRLRRGGGPPAAAVCDGAARGALGRRRAVARPVAPRGGVCCGVRGGLHGGRGPGARFRRLVREAARRDQPDVRGHGASSMAQHRVQHARHWCASGHWGGTPAAGPWGRREWVGAEGGAVAAATAVRRAGPDRALCHADANATRARAPLTQACTALLAITPTSSTSSWRPSPWRTCTASTRAGGPPSRGPPSGSRRPPLTPPLTPPLRDSTRGDPLTSSSASRRRHRGPSRCATGAAAAARPQRRPASRWTRAPRTRRARRRRGLGSSPPAGGTVQGRAAGGAAALLGVDRSRRADQAPRGLMAKQSPVTPLVRPGATWASFTY